MDPTTTSSQSDLGTTTLIIIWVFTSICVLVVIFRFWVRARIVQRFTIDDWTILLSLVLSLVNSVFLTISVHYGLGKHIASLSPEAAAASIKWALFAEVFGIMAPGIGRISFALLLMNILPPDTWRRRFLWIVIATQFIADVVVIVISFTQCRPLAKWWNPTIEGHCWPQKVQQYTGFTQGYLMLAIFPASLFWNLRMEWKVKLSLSLLMSLGLVALVANTIKTVDLKQLTSGKLDATYSFSGFVIWWTLEGYLVLIAACIPTLKPLFRRTGNTTHDSYGTAPSKKPSRWLGSQPLSKTRTSVTGTNSIDERPFFELGHTTPIVLDSNDGRVRYNYRAHTPSQGDGTSIAMPDAVVEKSIRKDTTTEVIYADAVSLENGVVGKW